MPSNIVGINNAPELTWELRDSKMDELIEHLDNVGFPAESVEGKTIFDASSSTC